MNIFKLINLKNKGIQLVFSFTFLVVLSLGVAFVYADNYVWTTLESQMGINFADSWTGVATSNSGQFIYAVRNGGKIYKSNDYGSSWAETCITESAYEWVSIATDASGQHIIIADSGLNGELFYSSDYGVTCSSVSLVGDWSDVAMSDNGNFVVAVQRSDTGTGMVYVSSSGPAYLAAVPEVSAGNRSTVSMSSDGSVIFVGDENGYSYVSRNGGSTWTAGDDRRWNDSAMTSDGSTIYGATEIGLFVSKNGSGFSMVPDFAFASVRSVDVSDNGQRVVVGKYDNEFNYVYTSIDYGVSWQVETSAPTGKLWRDFSFTENGGRFVALSSNSYIRMAADTTGPVVTYINRLGSSPAITNADGMGFVIKFSESVVGVDVDDFNIDTTGTVNATINGSIGYNPSVDGGTYEINFGHDLAPVSGDGTLSLSLNENNDIFDLLGYPVSLSIVQSQSFTIDNTSPVISSVSSNKIDDTYTVGEVIDIDVTFSEIVTSTGNVTVTLETGTTDRTCTFTVSSSTTGTCNYTVQAGDISSDLTVSSISGTITDRAGNAMSNFVPVSNLAAIKDLVIDTTSPNAPTSFTATPSGSTVNLSWTNPVSDFTSSTIRRSTSGFPTLITDGTLVANTTGTTYANTGLSDGTYYYSIFAKDSVNNVSTAATSTATVDATAPSVSITTPTNGASVSGTIALGASASDTVGVYGVQFKINTNTNIGSEDTISAYATSLDTTGFVDGEHEIIAVARDAAGNYATSSPVAIVVDNTDPEISNVETGSLDISSVTILWDTDEAADSLVEYGLSSTYTASSTYSATLETSHSVNLSSLTPNTAYHYRVVSVDALGNRSNGVDQTFTTLEDVVSGGGGEEDGNDEGGQITSGSTSASTRNQNNSEKNKTNKTRVNADYVFTQNALLGATNNEVINLQRLLNDLGFSVSTTGLGSVGNETNYFGPKTRGALALFQKSVGINPPVGYFGPITRSYINAMLKAIGIEAN